VIQTASRSRFWPGPRLARASLPYLLMAPALLLLVVLTLLPLLYSVVMSFFNAQLGQGLGRFVGLANYAVVLHDPRFWNAAWNTLVWVVGSVSSQIVVGVLLAIALDKLVFARLFFRGALFLPWVMPVVVIAYLWRWILNPQNGIVNVSLRTAGFEWGATLPWLSEPDTAMASALIVSLWRGMPFVLVMVLAALQGIPKEEYEAARIAGAGPMRELWYVTLPNLKMIIATIVLLRTMQVANNFSLMWLLTGGGPADSTEILPILVYVHAFGAHQLGQASALAVLLLLILMGIALVYVRAIRERRDV
jgi:ABC-type sugar transport systems, permease components